MPSYLVRPRRDLFRLTLSMPVDILQSHGMQPLNTIPLIFILLHIRRFRAMRAHWSVCLGLLAVTGMFEDAKVAVALGSAFITQITPV